jgi:hypothetical protein
MCCAGTQADEGRTDVAAVVVVVVTHTHAYATTEWTYIRTRTHSKMYKHKLRAYTVGPNVRRVKLYSLCAIMLLIIICLHNNWLYRMDTQRRSYKHPRTGFMNIRDSYILHSSINTLRVTDTKCVVQNTIGPLRINRTVKVRQSTKR